MEFCKYKNIAQLTKLTWKYRKVENVKLLSSKIRCDREKLERALMNKTVGFKKPAVVKDANFPPPLRDKSHEKIMMVHCKIMMVHPQNGS